MDSRESVRDRGRPLDQRDRRTKVRVLMVKDMTPQEFLERRTGGADMTLLDVREDWETTLAPVPADIVHIPMGQIADRLGELDSLRETVVICRSGGRSLQVAHFLSEHGFVSRLRSANPAILTSPERVLDSLVI